MNRHASFRAITRRALSVNYASPSTCPVPSDDASGSGDGSESISGFESFMQTPGPVLTLEVQSGTNVRLDWSAIPQAGFYRVWRSTTAEGPFALVQDFIGDLFYTDVPGTGTFFYYVTAIEPNSGETAPSNIESGTSI